MVVDGRRWSRLESTVDVGGTTGPSQSQDRIFRRASQDSGVDEVNFDRRIENCNQLA